MIRWMRVRMPLQGSWAMVVAAALGAMPLATAAVPVPVPLAAYVFRPGPAVALVARMDTTWREDSRYHAGELQEIRFVRTSGAGRTRAKLIVTPMATLPAEDLLRDDSAARQIVERQLAEMKKGGVAMNSVITDAKAGAARLVTFTAIDAHPKLGEFAMATQGVLVLAGMPCLMTILHDDASARDDVVGSLASWAVFGTPNVVRPPPEVPPARLEAACKAGDGLACGLAHELAAEDDKPGHALQLLATGCKKGSAYACASLGGLYAGGKDVPRDDARAMKVLVQGCDAHGALACVNAASLAVRGWPEGTPPPAQSLSFLERACGYGGDRGGVCRYSVDSDASPVAYVAKKRTDCAAGDGVACRHLGWAIETGFGDEVVDVDAARAAYAKACAAHSLWGCFRQALFTADAKEQARLFDAACDAGSGPACYALAQPKFGRTAEARRTLARKACESDIEEACADVLSSFAQAAK
jgi:TPR repeat protein